VVLEELLVHRAFLRLPSSCRRSGGLSRRRRALSVDIGQGSIWFQWDAFADPLGNFGSVSMATQIVMDHTGHTRHCFNPNDAQALASAERRFMELTGRGFTAAVRNGPGEITKVQSFDPTAEETLFFPRLVGG
jgi:hypothetical protein